MAVFSVICGFSLELGSAFVMGLYPCRHNGGGKDGEGGPACERPFRLAVFFISVGMMVDPAVLVSYWWEILLPAVVVICGMIFFGTLGMLVTGQTLRVAIESGFTLTRVGEFSFIIASLGMSLGVFAGINLSDNCGSVSDHHIHHSLFCETFTACLSVC